MKKNIILATLLLSLLLIILFLVVSNKKSIVGKWKSVGKKNEYYYIFNTDKSCSYKMTAAKLNCTYKLDDSKLIILYDGSKKNITFEYELDRSWWSGNTIGQVAKSIYIRVMKSGELVTLSADQGKAASKIAVGTDYDWCDERQDVDEKFGGKFTEYVGGAHSWNTWYK